MDLVTLVTACALAVEPRWMHALIWQQSGGEPWSFSVPGESWPRVLPTLQDAIHEARTARADGGRLHVGLTGLSTDVQSVTPATFAPCRNVAIAARQIAQLSEHCAALSRTTSGPIFCAIAAYHGSWERPDTTFAQAVRVTVEKGNAPNFELPKDANFDPAEIASDASAPDPRAPPIAPAVAIDDRERGWSSALFPAKPATPDGKSSGVSNRDKTADEPQSTDLGNAAPTASKSPANSLFVPRTPERRP
jgi:hypothetical protein